MKEMDVLTILLIALALAMDAFAVSIAKGIAVKIIGADQQSY